MQKYGILKNDNLTIVTSDTEGAKSIVYAEIPEFDQEKQAVFETAPVDMGDYIFVGVEVREVEQDDEQSEEMF